MTARVRASHASRAAACRAGPAAPAAPPARRAGRRPRRDIRIRPAAGGGGGGRLCLPSFLPACLPGPGPQTAAKACCSTPHSPPRPSPLRTRAGRRCVAEAATAASAAAGGGGVITCSRAHVIRRRSLSAASGAAAGGGCLAWTFPAMPLAAAGAGGGGTAWRVADGAGLAVLAYCGRQTSESKAVTDAVNEVLSGCQDVGCFCPLVVIDPADLGATTAVARNLLQD